MQNRYFPFTLTGLIVLILAGRAAGQISDGRFTPQSSQSTKSQAATLSQAEQAVSIATGDSRDIEPKVESIYYPQDISIGPLYSGPVKEYYVTTIRLAKLSWSENSMDIGKFGERLVVGVNSPYYRIKKEILVIGSFDLKIDGVILGWTNNIKITLKYNFRRSLSRNDTQMGLVVDNIAARVGIPFSLY